MARCVLFYFFEKMQVILLYWFAAHDSLPFKSL